MARSTEDERLRREIRDRIDTQTERIADLLGVDVEEINVYGTMGVILRPDQADALLALIPDRS